MKTTLIACCLFFTLIFIGNAAKPIKEIKLPDSPLCADLKDIKIPQITLEEASPQSVFKLLRQLSKKNDPKGKGINFILKGLKKHPYTISLELKDLPLGDVIRYICMTGNLSYKVEDFAVVIMPRKSKNAKKKPKGK